MAPARREILTAACSPASQLVTVRKSKVSPPHRGAGYTCLRGEVLPPSRNSFNSSLRRSRTALRAADERKEPMNPTNHQIHCFVLKRNLLVHAFLREMSFSILREEEESTLVA